MSTEEPLEEGIGSYLRTRPRYSLFGDIFTAVYDAEGSEAPALVRPAKPPVRCFAECSTARKPVDNLNVWQGPSNQTFFVASDDVVRRGR